MASRKNYETEGLTSVQETIGISGDANKRHGNISRNNIKTRDVNRRSDVIKSRKAKKSREATTAGKPHQKGRHQQQGPPETFERPEAVRTSSATGTPAIADTITTAWTQYDSNNIGHDRVSSYSRIS